MIIYLSTGSIVETGLVMLGVPFAAIGAVWLLWALDYNLSVAVWVGVIALAGLYAETAIVLLLYLDQSYKESNAAGRITDRNSLIQAIYRGSVQRVRPILMTVATDVIGLLPIMWSTGDRRGRDEAHRDAAGGRHPDFGLHSAGDSAGRLLLVARPHAAEGRSLLRFSRG